MKLKPDAILFDMDGVLIESLDSWHSALNESLDRFNHKTISRDKFIEKYWGQDLKITLENDGYEYDIIPLCNKIYPKHIDKVSIYPETIPTLEKLKCYKKAVITNTPRSCAPQVLDRFNLSKYFDILMTSNDVPIGKPHPEIILKACLKLNVKPENSIMIGDTLSDFIAGKAAGCTVIGVNISADHTISNLSDLLKIIEVK